MTIAENRNDVDTTAGHIETTTLAQQINQAHRQCEHAARSAVTHAVRCGELLLHAKAAVPHGGWLPWLAENTQVNERTAQLYMRLARELPKLDPSKAQRVADLPLREALRFIAGPPVLSDNELFEVCLQSIADACGAEELCFEAFRADGRMFVPAEELYEAVQGTMNVWGERVKTRLESASQIGDVVVVIREAQKLQNAAGQMTILAECCLGAVLTKMEAVKATDNCEVMSHA